MSCAVISCNNYKSRRLIGISFHRFPKEGDMLDKWVQSLGLPETWIWTPNKYVCSNHFNTEDFFNYKFHNDRRTLKITAIPSLLVYNKNKEIHKTISNIQTQYDGNYAQLDLPEIEEEKIEDVTVPESVMNLKRPLGEKFLRVCRICMTIHKKEDTIPLFMRGSVGTIELYNKLRDLLQMELYPVEDSCLCKRCENFIHEMFDFISTCKNNEQALTKFDWTNKSKNLLHIVNQGKVARLFDEIREPAVKQEKIEEMCEDFEEVVIKIEPNLEEFDEIGNGLSDMEDHWYYADDLQKKSYEFPRKPENGWNYCFKLPPGDDLFTPAFDKYFNTFRDQAGIRLVTKCRKYHAFQYGDPPYLCEVCGELKYSKPSLKKHIKDHSVGECNLRQLQCLICRKKFKYQKSLSVHLETHTKKVNLEKINRIGRRINGNSLRKFFSCKRCKRKYPKIRSLMLHKKQCDKAKNSENAQDLVLENYDFFIDDQGNAKIVILENDAKFFKEFKNGTIGLE